MILPVRSSCHSYRASSPLVPVKWMACSWRLRHIPAPSKSALGCRTVQAGHELCVTSSGKITRGLWNQSYTPLMLCHLEGMTSACQRIRSLHQNCKNQPGKYRPWPWRFTWPPVYLAERCSPSNAWCFHPLAGINFNAHGRGHWTEFFCLKGRWLKLLQCLAKISSIHVCKWAKVRVSNNGMLHGHSNPKVSCRCSI